MPDRSPEELADRLRGHGLRATTPRMAILRAVGELPGHPDTDAIATRARALVGTISLQAVYDSLHAMRVGDNHHHVVCRACGAARDIDCVIGAAPCLEPDDFGGFLIDEAEVTFWGLCPQCQAEAQA